MRVAEVPSVEETYSFPSISAVDQFMKFILLVINRLSKRKTRSREKNIDAIDIKLDLNLFRDQKIEYKWSHTPGKGFYKGFCTQENYWKSIM